MNKYFWISYDDVKDWYDGTPADFAAEFNFNQDTGEVTGAVYQD